MNAPVSRLSAPILHQLLGSERPPLILDVRRRKAFEDIPEALPGAIPLYLDADPVELPDVEKDQPLVAYCL